MNISLKKGKIDSISHSTLVVFIPELKSGKKLSIPGLEKEILDILNPSFEEGALTGKQNESLFFRNVVGLPFKHLMVIGLGDKKKIHGEELRIAMGKAYGAMTQNKVTKASFHVHSVARMMKNAAEAVEVLSQSLLLCKYTFDDHKYGADGSEKKSSEKDKFKEAEFLFTGSQTTAALKKSLETGQIIGECVNFTRWLGDHPGNLMTPSILANQTIKAAKGTKLKVTAWDKARIKKEKMGGLLGVSLGSSEEPRFIIMEYKGAAASKKPVCFVGKGLTFDSGGISIKPSQSMDEMKYDMQGGASVIGTMLAIARLKLKINAIGLVPASENMPGPAANKPGDILVARNGKSIEVLNTDAEGRLILADALCYASEKKPAAIFDAATLTGAMMVALGNVHTGFFTRNNYLVKKIEKASVTSGELVWRMPLTDFHSQDMKGNHADLSNISSSRGAGSSTAAAFLENFVDSKIPWAHFDIAGTAWNVNSRLPYCPSKGASGSIVRTFLELAKAY